MDEDIKNIKRRAGLKEQETYDLATQQQLDKLLDEELAQYTAVIRALATIRNHLRGNTLNPRRAAVSIQTVMSKLAQRYQELDQARKRTRRK